MFITKKSLNSLEPAWCGNILRDAIKYKHNLRHQGHVEKKCDESIYLMSTDDEPSGVGVMLAIASCIHPHIVENAN